MHFGSILRSDHLDIISQRFFVHTGATVDLTGQGHASGHGLGHGVTVIIFNYV